MSKYRIALATKNPRTFYIAVKILKRLALAFRSCTPNDQYCKEANLVITTSEEVDDTGCEHLLVIDEMPDESTTSLDVMMHYLSLIPPREIAIGIDPGLHNGIAVLVDGTPSFGRVLVSPIDTSALVTKLVVHVESKYPLSRVYIRIGIGSKLHSTLLLRELVRRLPASRLEMVDERNTTTQGGYFKDQFSAELIALRPGRGHTADDLKLEPKRGFIRGLQHLFTWLTDNKETLSIESVRQILRGDITLEDALSIHETPEKNSSTA